MSIRLLPILFLSFLTTLSFAQSDLPFNAIPEHGDQYESSDVVARMIDALGFRYRYASEDLTVTDLSFRPSDDSRSIKETIEHIYYLVTVISNAQNNIENEGVDISNKSFSELRTETLLMLFEVRENLVNSKPDLSQLKIKYPQNSFPYWYVISGPLSDALYHTGQLVMLRRISGNPVRPDVDVFQGKIRN